jgi:hypothetical protein
VIAQGTGTSGPAVTEDKQCTACENPQGSYSLIQRRNIATTSATAPPPEFVGKQFQNASQSEIEAFTKAKIDQVIEKIVFDIMIPKRSSKAPVLPGDDLYGLIMSDSLLITFMDDLATITWNDSQ